MDNEDACKLVRKTLAENIKRCRKEAHLSQQKLADSIGMNRTYLSDIEVGEGNPSLDVIVKISRGLDVSLAYLFKDFDEPIK